MKRIVFTLVVLLAVTFAVYGQKNVTIVTNSGITGISLPEGSKEDKRMLPLAAARTLLELTAKELGRVLRGDLEVLSLPPSDDSAPQAILRKIADAGFVVEEQKGFSEYAILKREGKEFLVYLSAGKISTEFYTGMLEPLVTITTNLPEIQDDKSHPAITISPEFTNEAKTGSEVPEQRTIIQRSTGFTYITTNFDDGWTAYSETEFILVKKSELKVRLYFPSEITENMRPPVTELTDYFWNTLVLPEFTIVNSWRFEQPLSFFSTNYMYAQAIEKSTGRNAFIGLNVESNTGIAYPVLAIAPDRESYEKQFPEPKSVSNMLVYNRFAVALPDLEGKWTASSGSGIDYYNTLTGAYAGMAIAQSSDEFVFHTTGDYTSRHSGATGMVGSIQTYDQNYSGKVNVSNWEIILTNRFKGATDTFEAWFEVVKGGRILRLVNKEATGIRYALVRFEGNS